MAIEDVTAWVMLIALLSYVLLGGADFGGGVWDLLAVTKRGEAQRRKIRDAIGPVWEANHVWLIVVIVLMFTGFPRAFAAIMTALHVPVTIMLIGIVLRGSAFTFATYDRPGPAQERWRMIFSWSSLLTPVLLGVTLGTIASGRLQWNDEGVYVSGFFQPWLTPFPWVVGLFTVAIFALLAAVYLCAETEGALQESFRRRAIGAWVAVAVLGILAWIFAGWGAPTFAARLTQPWWSWPLRILTALFAAGSLFLLIKRRVYLARACTVVQVTLIVLGYGLAQFSYLVVPQFTIQNSAASPRMHSLLLGALGFGAIILLPSFWYLFRVFKGQRAFAVMDRAGGSTQDVGSD